MNFQVTLVNDYELWDYFSSLLLGAEIVPTDRKKVTP